MKENYDYVLLKEGDEIKEGDEYFSKVSAEWLKSHRVGGNCDDEIPYRRRVAKDNDLQHQLVSLKAQFRHLAATIKDGTPSALDKIWQQAQAMTKRDAAYNKLRRENKELRDAVKVVQIDDNGVIRECPSESDQVRKLKAEIEELKKQALKINWHPVHHWESDELAHEYNGMLEVCWNRQRCVIPLPPSAKDPAEEAWEKSDTAKNFVRGIDYEKGKKTFISGFRAAKGEMK